MVSINTNISSLVAQQNLSSADSASQSSIARLSSGNRIIRAADDAAGLAVGTGLRSDVSTLRTALTNTSQANSVLSIADGALFNIGEILQRQKALATQANSDSLSSTERAFLDSEFQNLAQEIDRISESTNFNGILLIDGSIAGDSGVTTDTTGATEKFVASIDFGATIEVSDDLLVINGVNFRTNNSQDANGSDLNAAALQIDLAVNNSLDIDGNITDTQTGAGLAETIAYIINNAGDTGVGITGQEKIDKLSALTATVSGSTLTVTSRSNGAAGTFDVEKNDADDDRVVSVTGGDVTITGASTGGVTAVSNSTSDTAGSLGSGAVTASGTVGSSLISALFSTKATLDMTFLAGDLDDASGLTVFGRDFTLQSTVSDPDTQIQVGNNDKETIANIISFLNSSDDPTISRFNYSMFSAVPTNLQMSIDSKTETTSQTTNLSITDDSGTETLTAGDGGGIDVANVTDNEAFVGTISGFTAEYTGTNAVELSVTVGAYTYTGTIQDTTTSTANVRLTSTDVDGAGGFFEIDLVGTSTNAVANQTQANNFAEAIDNAFSSVVFQQNRDVSSFDTTGTLLEGGKVSINSATFAGLEVASVNVSQATSANANNGAISITLSDGRIFENTTLGRQISAGEEISLTNREDSNEVITIIQGQNTIDLDNASEVARLQSELTEGFSSGSGGLDFQIGIDSQDTIAVQVNAANTAELYAGQTLDLQSKETAVNAGKVLDDAINKVTALRADIGSLQSRFDFAAANLETTIQNTDAARGDFLDADVASESTAFATNQVLLQASISVLAQANQLPQNLLKLIG